MNKLDLLPKVAVKVSGQVYDVNYEELRISRETLDDDMLVQSALYAYYAVIAALLDEEVGQKKLEHEMLEASLYEEHKQRMMDETSKVTERAIEVKVVQDDRYAASYLALLEAKRNKAIFDAVVRALEHRREMLINLGAKYRREMDGDVIFKKPGEQGEK